MKQFSVLDCSLQQKRGKLENTEAFAGVRGSFCCGIQHFFSTHLDSLTECLLLSQGGANFLFLCLGDNTSLPVSRSFPFCSQVQGYQIQQTKIQDVRLNLNSNIQQIDLLSMSSTIFGTFLYQNLFVVYLIFKCNWVSYILSGNSIQVAFLSFNADQGRPQLVVQKGFVCTLFLFLKGPTAIYITYGQLTLCNVN